MPLTLIVLLWDSIKSLLCLRSTFAQGNCEVFPYLEQFSFQIPSYKRWTGGFYRKGKGGSISDQGRRFESAKSLAMSLIVTFALGASFVGQAPFMGSRIICNEGSFNHVYFLSHVAAEPVVGDERIKWEQGLYHMSPSHDNLFENDMKYGGKSRSYNDGDYEYNGGRMVLLRRNVGGQRTNFGTVGTVKLVSETGDTVNFNSGGWKFSFKPQSKAVVRGNQTSDLGPVIAEMEEMLWELLIRALQTGSTD